MSEFFIYSHLFDDCFFEHGELVEYTKGQPIVWQKDKSEWVFFPLEGLVRMTLSFSNDTNSILGYIVPGIVFAQAGSFWNMHDDTLSFVAEMPTKIYRMKRQKFLKILEDDPKLMQEYLNMTLRHQIFFIDRVSFQAEKLLLNRCARWLLFMAKYYGKNSGDRSEITVPLTQETAAGFLGTTRESVNGVLRGLAEEDVITLSTKRIVIKNKKKLLGLLS